MMDPTKSSLRREMKARRKKLPPAAKAAADAAVRDKLAALEFADGTGGFVAAYLASNDEIDIDPFIGNLLRGGVEVAAPRWNGSAYDLARLKGLDAGSLRTGPMGIREPAEADIVRPEEVRAWIVPGLAFTPDGKRLGYGGGWYDRFLAAASPHAAKIGVAYSFQIVGDIPAEPHDMRLTGVVDETPAPLKHVPSPALQIL